MLRSLVGSEMCIRDSPQQGSYFGYQSWDVTNYITGGDSTMTFDRNSTDSGSYSGYFKIPLALLTVEEEE